MVGQESSIHCGRIGSQDSKFSQYAGDRRDSIYAIEKQTSAPHLLPHNLDDRSIRRIPCPSHFGCGTICKPVAHPERQDILKRVYSLSNVLANIQWETKEIYEDRVCMGPS